jgi:prevent-host-death family protein
MTAIALTQFRKHLSDVVQQAIELREPVFITRAAGEGVVLIPADEWADIMETLHLTASEKNLERLQSADAQVEIEIARRQSA